jgi:hypothetical protein
MKRKCSELTFEVKQGFKFRELSPTESAKLEDKARAIAGTGNSSQYEVEATRLKFVKSCIAFPAELVNSDKFEEPFECNKENKEYLFDWQPYFCQTITKVAIATMINMRLDELKNFAPGLFGGGTERVEEQ